MADDSLTAHTPSPEYMRNLLVRRAIELLGADKATAGRIVPEPYKSDYRPSNKLLDAMLTLSLDPVVKPASLKGKLGSMPALDALAQQLANKGYFQRYPGGGIGIGGGPGEPGMSGTNTGGDPAVGDPGVTGTGTPDDPIAMPPVTVTASPIGPDEEPGQNVSGRGTPSVGIGDLSKSADDQPFSWQRLIDALKGLVGGGPARGTDIGRAAGLGTAGLSLASRLGLLGPGIGGQIGAGLVGGLARGAAGDAASRASAAIAQSLPGFGLENNPAVMNAVIGGMAGPIGPSDPGGQGQGGGTVFGGAVSPGSEITATLTGVPQTSAQTAAARTGTPSSALFPGAVADMQARGVLSGDNPWALAQSVFPQAQAASPGITLDKLVGEAKKFFEV